MMRSVEKEDGEFLSSGILLFIFALIVAGCCLTAIADDAVVSSTSKVVTLDVQNMT